MAKIKNFFRKIWPSKRKWMQLYFALLFNANAKGFIQGEIYKGDSKQVCVPGINCYSCPGAVGACPLGSLQGSLGDKSTFFYVGGTLVLYGILFGRMVCGWLCPFGFIQELLHKIKTPKVKKSPITRVLSYLKYVLLVFFVFIVPFLYAIRDMQVPAFCKYICPAGTIEGGLSLLSYNSNSQLLQVLGPIFTWKFMLMVSMVVGCIFIFRLFCRFFCPLGALYALFNRFSIFGIKLNRDKCVDCNRCIAHCEMDIHHVGDTECINCGECITVCPTDAIQWKGPKILLPKNEIAAEETPAAKPNQKKRLVTRILSTVVLLAILVGTGVYHWKISSNTVDLSQYASDPNRGNQIGDLCYGVELKVTSAKGLTGETLDPTSLKKVTIINFWYTECGPCVKELPYFDQVARKYKDDVAVVTVHGMFPNAAPAFIKEHYPDSPMIFVEDFIPEGATRGEADRCGYYTLLGGINNSYPRTVILDEKGVITHTFEADVHLEDLEKAVKSLLNK